MNRPPPVRSRIGGNDPPRKGSLPPPRQRLVELMQEIHFGRIERLLIRDHQPQWRPAPRILRDVALGKESRPRRRGERGDFQLKGTVRDPFRHLDRLSDGTMITLIIQDGLPIRLIIEEPIEA